MRTPFNEYYASYQDAPSHFESIKQQPSFSLIAGIALLAVLVTPDFFVDIPDLVSLLSVAAAAAGMAQLGLVAPRFALPLTVLACYLKGLYLTASPLYAFGYLLPLPFAIVLILVMKKKLNRGTAISLVGGLTASIVLLTMAGQVISISGTLSLNAAKTVFSPFVQTLKDLLSSFTVTIAGRELPYFNDTTSDALIELALALFPGLLAAVLFMVGYLSSYLYRFFIGIFFATRPDPAHWRISPSPVSAVYFLLLLLLCLVLPEDNVFWLAATNLLLCLLPLFLVAGFGSCFGTRIVNGLPRPLLLRPTLLLIAMVNGFFVCLILLVFFGLFDSIKSALLKRKSSDDSPIS